MRRGRNEGRMIRAVSYRSQWDPFRGSHEQAYNWRDDASCVSLPAELFEVALEGDPQVAGMTLQEIVMRNEDNFEQATQACSTCPVAQQCLASASRRGEQYWTTRGGKKPGALNNLLRTAKDQNGFPLRRCPRGHRNWRFRVKKGSNGDFECRTCKSMLDKRFHPRSATLEG